MLALLLLTADGPPDTLRVRSVDRLPAPMSDSLGEPTLRFGAGRARLWLLRDADTIAVYVAIRDSTHSLKDEIVVSLDMEGDAAPTPQHDDFQWRLRRGLDSTTVLRGRGGRWQPPKDDPDWRLGPERSGGGWSVAEAERDGEWWTALRLHAAMLAGGPAAGSRLAVRIYDGGPGGWYAWPREKTGAHPTSVEGAPSGWAIVR